MASKYTCNNCKKIVNSQNELITHFKSCPKLNDKTKKMVKELEIKSQNQAFISAQLKKDYPERYIQ